MNHKHELYGGIVWILSGVALTIYGALMLSNTNIPGIEQLVNFLASIDTTYIYLTAFISVFIEGLYFIGSFFPGASLVLLVAILSRTSGISTLLMTLFIIFIGWCLAGIVNIYLAKIYRTKIIKLEECEDFHVKDHVWVTWFPAFRSSHEVAQVAAGGKIWKVFLSSLRVRLWATLLVGVLAVTIPLFFDVTTTTNKEGFASIAIVIVISIWVGVVKIRKYISNHQL